MKCLSRFARLELRRRNSPCVRFLAALAAAICSLAAQSPAQDVLTHHNDFFRSGVQSLETQLTPETVAPTTFGKLFTLPVDGQIFAQPLWVGGYTMADGKPHNVLFVATAHDSVYAFDADGRTPAGGYYWRVNLLGRGETTVPAADTQTSDIQPEVGIVGTPVIDRTAGVIYVLAQSKLSNSSGVTYYQRLHALSLTNGTEMMNGPVAIRPTVDGSGDGSSGGKIVFNALTQNQRAALALADGSVWIAWASHGDNYPYHGFLMGFNADNLAKPSGLFVDTPNGSSGGIWMSGGGISVDKSGSLYLASGNGTFDANTQGGMDYADSALKFTPASGGLDLVTSFTPYDQDNLSMQDLDFGTSACTLFDNPGATNPHLLVTTDKSGQIYLLDRDQMGGYLQSSNEDIQDFQDGGFDVHASFAFFNNTLYLAPDGGPLSAWTFNPTTGLFNTTPATASNSTFGCDGCDGAGGTPSISANGTANAIVWILDNSGFIYNPAVLHAWDPSLNTELYSSTTAANYRDAAGNAVKFTTPTIANGFVYVGGTSVVTVYGLFKNTPPAWAPVFSPAPGDYTGTISVAITDQTHDATIHYTLNGDTPTASSPSYYKPLAVSSAISIKAIATAKGYAASPVLQADYVVGAAGNVFTLNKGLAASDLYLNGSAEIISNRLRLTNGGTGEAGSAYYRSPVHIANFTTRFDFQITDPNAEGMTFVLQNEGPTALGPAGGGLGYGPAAPGGKPGISPSEAVKFDLNNNAGEGADSTGFYANGVSPTIPALNLNNAGLDLHSGHVFNATLRYNGARLFETITDTVTHKSATFFQATGLPHTLGANSAYAGFTGSTGSKTAIADVLDWSWSVPAAEAFAAAALPATVSKSTPKLVPWSDPEFPKGTGVLFLSTAIGQSVTFTVDVENEATFSIELLADRGPRRGMMQLAIDGKNFGTVTDEYAASIAPFTENLGNLLLTAGNHTFTFTVTGKRESSAGYAETFGRLTLVP